MSVSSYNPEVRKVIENMLLEYPFVKWGLTHSFLAYHTGDRNYFIILLKEGVAVKVHQPMANMLTEIYEHPQIQSSEIFKGRYWVQLECKRPEDYASYSSVIKEAMLYALGLVY